MNKIVQPITRTRSRNRGKARTNERTNEGTGANQFSEEARSTTLESFYFHARGKRSSLVQPAPTPRPAVPTDPTTLWIRSGVLRSASARANSSSRTRVQLLSSLFLQLAFIRAARFNSGCGAPRAKSGNARGKLFSLFLSLSLSFAARFCAHRETRRVSSGITQLCKAGGVPSSCDR